MDEEASLRMKHLLLPETTSSNADDSHEQHFHRKYIQFSSRLKHPNKDQLNEYFLDINSKRSTVNNAKSVCVAENIQKLMNTLAEAIGEIDERFHSKCVPSGSYFDELKIDDPDEFDFVFEIEALSKPGMCQVITSEENIGKAFIFVIDKRVADKFAQFLCHPEEQTAFVRDTKGVSVEGTLSVRKLNEYFHSLIYEALEQIELQQEFLYGEINGPFNHGPCARIVVEYTDDSNIKCNVDVDIAPGICIPEKTVIPPLLQKGFIPGDVNENFWALIVDIFEKSDILLVPFPFDTLSKTFQQCWKYNYSETWRISLQNIERNLFKTFPTNSTEKRVVRILKILVKDHFNETKEVVHESEAGHMKTEEPPSTILTKVSVTPLFGGGGGGDDDDDDDDVDDVEVSTVGNASGMGESTIKNDELLAKPSCLIQHIAAINSSEYFQNEEQIVTTDDEDVDSDNDWDEELSRSLLKSYCLKMMFFYAKLATHEKELWPEENLADIILFMLDALYYVFSSKEKNFLHFWFQTRVGQPTRDSTRVEILHCLDELSRWACTHYLEV